MVEIVKIDMDVLSKVPNILKCIEKICGYDVPLVVYGILNEGKFGFVVKNGSNCIYFVDNDLKLINFEVNEDNDLLSITKDGYKKEYCDDDDIYINLDTGIECFLNIEKNEKKDIEGYDGLVNFVQYDIKRDLRCEMQYPHMFRESINGKNPPIYEYHTSSFRTLFIDKKYYEKGLKENGILGNRHLYYNKMTVYNGDPDYTISAINDFGLLNVLSDGAYALYGTDKIYKYCRAKFICNNGYYVTLFPFCSTYNEESLKEYVEDLGFSATIPKYVFNSYNGYDEELNVIEEIVKQMKEIDKNKKDDMKMILKLQQD